MAEFPGLTIWTDSYLADTHPGLSLEEHGAYFLLLMFAWRTPDCSLPDDDEWIRRKLGIKYQTWQRLRPVVLEAFWSLDDGRWRQKRLCKERAKADHKSSISAASAKTGWKHRKAKLLKSLIPNDANALPTHQSGNATTSTSTSIKKEKKERLFINDGAVVDGKSGFESPGPPGRKREINGKGAGETAIAKSDWPPDYGEQFWKAYPRRVGKKAAMDKLGKIKKRCEVSWQALMSGVLRYAAAVKHSDPQYIKHPSTWLNAGCWDDEHAPAQPRLNLAPM